MGALFIKSNPQLAYPPVMEEKIWAWVKEAQPRLLKLKRPQQTKIGLDLSGLPSHYPAERMLTRMMSVPVTLAPASSQVGGVIPGASWTFSPFRARRLTIYLGRGGSLGHNQREGLQHELRHMVQSLLGDALGVDPNDPDAINIKPVGVPVPWAKGPHPQTKLQKKVHRLVTEMEDLSPYSDRYKDLERQVIDYQKMTRYYLDAVEFYPHLGDRKAELDRAYPGKLIPDADLKAYLGGKEGTRAGTSNFVNANREFASERFKVLAGELKAWQQRRNEELKPKLDAAQGKKPRPTTTSRLVSFVQDDLDQEDAVLARYLRKDREKYMTFANNMVQYGEEPL